MVVVEFVLTVICDGCPAAYHTHCIDGYIPADGLEAMGESHWFCPHCSAGEFITYGDLIWAKV